MIEISDCQNWNLAKIIKSLHSNIIASAGPRIEEGSPIIFSEV